MHLQCNVSGLGTLVGSMEGSAVGSNVGLKVDSGVGDKVFVGRTVEVGLLLLGR